MKPNQAPFRSPWGFTLIEIMVVVAIIGVIMAAGVPSLYRLMKKEGYRKSVSDIQEVCQAARRQAILQGTMAEVVLYPLESRMTGGGRSATWDMARLEMLDVNLAEYKDSEMARVRFYPNGTSDEMTLILVAEGNQWRKISVELTTGLASIESDPTKWR